MNNRCLTPIVLMSAWLVVTLAGCMRLPYTTQVLHEDRRVRMTLEREVMPSGYSHPLHVSPAEVASILRGFSIREQQRLPLRWFAEEAPPKPLFRADEIEALAPYLADALSKAGPDERAHFEVIAPGFNPNMRNDVVGGWVAVRDPYLYLTMEYFHTQIPTRKSDLYDYNYPTPPPLPREYLLYFEPGRFWITDQRGERALDYREFLKSAASGPGTTAPNIPAGTP
ncbi:hypothetical protein [Candidatus Nitrospira bockiana]